MVRKKHSGEADQLTLASGGSEHAQSFSVAISWGNKMNFSLYANMAGFCSGGHKCHSINKFSVGLHSVVVLEKKCVTQ